MLSTKTNKILVLEDDAKTADLVIAGLTDAGFAVDWEQDGAAGLRRALRENYEMLILDRMLPGKDGISVMQALRENQRKLPIIIISAIGTTDERVKGLKAGCDDYLVKPFAISELVARMEALRRRSEANTQTRLSCGDLELDLVSARAERVGQSIALQPREFRLLHFFMRNQNHVITRAMILKEIWGYDFDTGTNVVDVHISNLRRKIDKKGKRPLLHTVRGAGYLFGKMA